MADLRKRDGKKPLADSAMKNSQFFAQSLR
jgi:hypothetical protein